MSDSAARDGFAAFFRRYTQTWVHAVAVAAMTALGTLTIVHRWFAALAVAAYLVPPVALYLSDGRGRPERAGAAEDGPPGPAETRTAPERAGPEEGTDDSAERTAAAWTSAGSPVGADLHDAAVLPGAAYAVGADGVVLADRGDGWTVALQDGPGAEANALRGVDATADGAAVWVAGDGGALGRLDAATGRHADLSAPEGITDAWADVAVAGDGGDETVLLVNGSGEVLRGRYRDGEVAWSPPEKPGGGSSIVGVDLQGSVGYLCDTNDGVFETVDGGETFGRVGVDGADGTLTDVAAGGEGDCLVAADDGVLHRYDGRRWTPERVCDRPLWALARLGDYAVAGDDDGAVHERRDATGSWERTQTPASAPLRGVAAGEVRAVAVGDDGTVVERRREGPR